MRAIRRAAVRPDAASWTGIAANDAPAGGGNVFDDRQMGANVFAAQEEERRRVSRELHDELGQRLALLEIQIEEMKRRLGGDERLAADLAALRARVGEISDDVHRICYRLHPAILENLGLIAALRAYCDEQSAWSGIKTRFSYCGIPSSLPSSVALCVYRVVQEALRNVAKHARATRALVVLRGNPQGLQVVIKDTGRGFNPGETRKGGLGLISLRERVRMAGGSCVIRSVPEHGTRIQIWVPLAMGACAG